MIANLSGTPSRLCQSALTTSPATIYTALSDGRTAILDVMVVNTTSAPLNVTMYIGSAATANAFGFYSTVIAAYSSLQWSGFQILNANEAFLALGSGLGLTVTISGLERV